MKVKQMKLVKKLIMEQVKQVKQVKQVEQVKQASKIQLTATGYSQDGQEK